MKKKEMWEKAEISTRNCYNAIVQNGIVSCRLSTPVPLWDGKNNKLTDRRVASRGIIFASCKDCSDFDNDWDTHPALSFLSASAMWTNKTDGTKKYLHPQKEVT